MPSANIAEFATALTECIKVLKTAKKHKVNLSLHSYYAEKVPTKLAGVRRAFLKLQRDYPKERFPSVAFRLATLEPLVNKAVEIYPSPPAQMIELLGEVKFREQSELRAEIEMAETQTVTDAQPPFLPEDLIEERHGILKRVLWEINETYLAACYNSCAAMIRRLTEALIIEAYEHHGLRHIIVDGNGDYLGFKDLIGKASAQPEFKLTRETKRVLPDLKFYGDYGVHNRMGLVRKQDLDRLHNATRAAIEELTRNI
jgi:hypothetical protein